MTEEDLLVSPLICDVTFVNRFTHKIDMFPRSPKTRILCMFIWYENAFWLNLVNFDTLCLLPQVHDRRELRQKRIVDLGLDLGSGKILGPKRTRIFQMFLGFICGRTEYDVAVKLANRYISDDVCIWAKSERVHRESNSLSWCKTLHEANGGDWWGLIRYH